MKTKTKWYRQDRTLVEEWVGDGVTVVYVDGIPFDGTFHEAVVATKQKPLIEMRERCLEMAEECRQIRKQGRNTE